MMTKRRRTRHRSTSIVRGVCNICHQIAELTWDHVPPKGASTLRSIEMRHFLDHFRTTAKHPMKIHTVGDDSSLPAGAKFSQNGIKFRSICAHCNNNLLGSRYDPELKRVYQEVGRVVNACFKTGLTLPSEIRIPVKSHSLVRGIVGHVLAAHGVNDQIEPDSDIGFRSQLRAYLLDETLPIPPSVTIYYWTYPGTTQAIVPGLSILQPGGSRALLGDLIKFFPLAYYISNNKMSSWDLDVPRIVGDGCNDLDCTIELIVRTRDVPPLDWPEVPTEHHATMMPSELAVFAKAR